MQRKAPLTVEVVWTAESKLGEGPVWDDETETVLWVDIKGRRLNAYDVKHNVNRSIELWTEVGAIALRSSGSLVAATREGFALLDRVTGTLDVLSDPEAQLTENRFNDGRCDPAGRFIADSMHDLERSPSGSVYSLREDRNGRPSFRWIRRLQWPRFQSKWSDLIFLR